MKASLYLALIHHPVTNKKGEEATTSVTNLDIHDISRSCRTFGVKKYYLVTPLEAQHDLVGRILGHWHTDKASVYNPDRQDALSIASLSYSLQHTIDDITQIHGQRPLLVVTGANFKQYSLDALQLKQTLQIDERPYLLIFGTGWGLHASILEQADHFLGPIKSPESDYNHLSVRSAVAIYLDRLCAGL